MLTPKFSDSDHPHPDFTRFRSPQARETQCPRRRVISKQQSQRELDLARRRSGV